MKAFQIICLLLVVVTLSTQSARHLYVKYFEVRTSVLDKYDEQTQKEIEKAKSLDELATKYAPAKQRKDELDDLKKEEAKKKAEKDRYDFRSEFRTEHKDDYAREEDLRNAIHEWESRSNEVRELRTFWAFGFVMLVLGCLVYLKWPWLGMAFIVPGFIEMIWWTSPSFKWGGAVLEFERLLNNKIIFTNITLVLVVVVWMLGRFIQRRNDRTRTS